MFSRSISLLRTAKHLKQNNFNLQLVPVRNSHNCNYRKGFNDHPKYVTYGAEIVMAYAWWWVLWHLFTEPDHITGEFPLPDVKKWTDEELGIPPDDA